MTVDMVCEHGRGPCGFCASTVDLSSVRLDLDRKFTRCGWAKECERIAKCVGILRRGIPIADRPDSLVREVEVRESWHGFHLTLTLTVPLPDARSLVAVQAILGSDAAREAAMLTRAWDGRPDDWNRLFDQKQGGPRVKPRLDYAAVLRVALAREGESPTVKAPPTYGTGI